MSDKRDIRIPKERPMTPAEGAPLTTWREEPTGVHTDAQVFRAVKALGDELAKNKLEAAKAHGALKAEITDFKTAVDSRLDKQDIALARIGGQMDVLVPMARTRPNSSETKAIAEKAIAASAVTFRRNLILKIVGGAVTLLTSGAFLGWWLS